MKICIERSVIGLGLKLTWSCVPVIYYKPKNILSVYGIQLQNNSDKYLLYNPCFSCHHNIYSFLNPLYGKEQPVLLLVKREGRKKISSYSKKYRNSRI